MRCGTLAYATSSGLGILAKSFSDAGVVTDTLVVRHGKHHTHDEWYPNSQQLTDTADHRKAKSFCDGMDVMLFFETPFIWDLIPYCRSKGIKTVLMPMHECLHQRVWTHLPDLFLCPSLLDLEVINSHANGYKDMTTYAKRVFLPVPVQVPWRQRTIAKTFIHNAGHGGLRGRNGTAELIEAMSYVKSGAKLSISTQTKNSGIKATKNIEVIEGTLPYKTLFADGDVFAFVERHNGLALPLQEARAAGMLVVCGDRFPMNTWLPKEPLVPIKSYNRNQRIGPPYQPFDQAVFDPRDIAATIDRWYNQDISEYSLQGKEWAESMSWAALKPKYTELLEGLLK